MTRVTSPCRRQHLEVEHQPGVVGVGGRHAHGPVEVRQGIVPRVGLGLLDAALDLAHGLEILADPGAIGRAEPVLQAGDLLGDRVEEAGALPQAGAAVRGVAALAEQPLEDDPRMGLGRQRRRRRGPREVVLINAGVAVIALADGREQVHRHLERRQLRLLADLLRGDLVNGGPEIIVRALGQLRPGGAQERGVGRRVSPGIGVLQLEVGDRRHVSLDRGQRAQGRRQFVESLPAGRSPPGDVAPHRHVDEPQASQTGRGGRRRGQRGHRGDHRVQERQRQGRPQAPEERPAGQGLLHDDHSVVLIWNGVLPAIPTIRDENR